MAQSTRDTFQERLPGTLPGWFGLELQRVEHGLVAARLEIAPEHLAPNGYLHAATVILLADSSAGYASIAHLPDGAKNFTTVELKSNFLATTRDGTIRCECRADHPGRTTHVWSVIVFGPGERRLALFRCTQLILW